MTNLADLEAGILQAVRDAKLGKAAKTHSVESLAARRRGRPPLPMVKVAVKIRLDADLLSTLRLSGAGWQTRINDVLRREFMTAKTTAQMINVPVVPVSMPESRPFLMASDSSNFSNFFPKVILEGRRHHA